MAANADHSSCPSCPQCGKHLCCEVHDLDNPRAPVLRIDLTTIDPPAQAGDGTACFHCGAVLRWASQNRLRVATRDEIVSALMTDTGFRAFHDVLREIHPCELGGTLS